jgi:chromosome partitioning protein
VLLVDLDQQASSTRYVGINPDEVNPSFYHVFLKQVPASVVRRKTPFNFDILPSSSLMAAVEESLDPGDERMLRDILEPLHDEYDFILIDTPPGKAGLAFNGIVAADMLLVPASAERMSIDGVSDLVNHVQEIFWHRFREELKHQEIRVLFTMYKANTTHSPGVVEASQRIYRDNVLDIYIPEAIEFPRSFDRRTPIIQLSPKHPGALAYYQVAEWIIAHAPTSARSL